MTSIEPATGPCAGCTAGPAGKEGHAAMKQSVGGPFPGHHFFRCVACGTCWIRHYGSPEAPYAWTSHVPVMPPRRAGLVARKGVTS